MATVTWRKKWEQKQGEQIRLYNFRLLHVSCDRSNLGTPVEHMPAHRNLRCGFCLKDFSKIWHVRLHVNNSPVCSATRDNLKQDKARDRDQDLGCQRESPLGGSFSNSNLPSDDTDGIAAEHDEVDYIPSE